MPGRKKRGTDAGSAEKWVKALLRWYRDHQRVLPWRTRSRPYFVLVSEVMLQQTRVDTVIPYFRAFIRRFPSLKSLAESSLHDVLYVWQGLGYYARARNLRLAAQTIVQQYGGRVPRDMTQLRSLPGIGAYTAAAIASIAYGEPVAALDTNALRVFARFWSIRHPLGGTTLHQSVRKAVTGAFPVNAAGDFNQAVMELGALICVSTPKCPACPVKRWCCGFRTGRAGKLPRRAAKKAVPHYDIAVGVVKRRGKLLIARRPENAMLGGLWEFPGGKRRKGEKLVDALCREVYEETGVRVKECSSLCLVRHAYSHFKVTLHVFQCRYVSGRARAKGSAEVRWVRPSDLGEYPFPTANRRIVDLLTA